MNWSLLVTLYLIGWLDSSLLLGRIVYADGYDDSTSALLGLMVSLLWPILLPMAILVALVSKSIVVLSGE